MKGSDSMNRTCLEFRPLLLEQQLVDEDLVTHFRPSNRNHTLARVWAHYGMVWYGGILLPGGNYVLESEKP